MPGHPTEIPMTRRRLKGCWAELHGAGCWPPGCLPHDVMLWPFFLSWDLLQSLKMWSLSQQCQLLSWDNLAVRFSPEDMVSLILGYWMWIQGGAAFIAGPHHEAAHRALGHFLGTVPAQDLVEQYPSSLTEITLPWNLQSRLKWEWNKKRHKYYP